MGPRRLETNRSVRPPAKRDRIFFETRTKLFDSLTNHIDGDLNSSHQRNPLRSSRIFVLDAQGLPISKILRAAALPFG
jgi:hypothetical protein